MFHAEHVTLDRTPQTEVDAEVTGNIWQTLRRDGRLEDVCRRYHELHQDVVRQVMEETNVS